MRSRVFPSLPTACPTRFSSRAICSLADTMSLNVSAILPSSPTHATGKRTEKSPSRMVCRLARISARLSDSAPFRRAWFPERLARRSDVRGLVDSLGGTVVPVAIIQNSPRQRGIKLSRLRLLHHNHSRPDFDKEHPQESATGSRALMPIRQLGRFPTKFTMPAGRIRDAWQPKKLSSAAAVEQILLSRFFRRPETGTVAGQVTPTMLPTCGLEDTATSRSKSASNAILPTCGAASKYDTGCDSCLTFYRAG